MRLRIYDDLWINFSCTLPMVKKVFFTSPREWRRSCRLFLHSTPWDTGQGWWGFRDCSLTLSYFWHTLSHLHTSNCKKILSHWMWINISAKFQIGTIPRVLLIITRGRREKETDRRLHGSGGQKEGRPQFGACMHGHLCWLFGLICNSNGVIQTI